MPKKIMSITFALLTLAFVWGINSTPLFKGYSSQYEVYLKSNSSNAQIINCCVKNLWKYFTRYGESCYVENFADFTDNPTSFIEELGGKVIFTEQTEKGVSYYGYSPKIKYSKVINGKTINLHLFVGSDYAKIGSPIIFGSY